MDPATVLFRLIALSAAIDYVEHTYHTIPGALASIKSQLKTLESGLERIQEWQHYTDPQSEAQVLPSLHEAMKTVGGYLLRLRDDLESTQQPGNSATSSFDRTGIESRTKVQPTFNEPRLNRYLIDLQHCVSLTQFTLLVCQLPLGRAAEQEVKELVLGAKTLQHAHTSNGDERQSIINAQKLIVNEHGSADFSTFVAAVAAADGELDVKSKHDSSIWATPQNDAYARSTRSTPRNRDGDELFLPENEEDTLSALDRPLPPLPPKESSTPSSQAGPALPPKIQRTPSKPASTTLQKQLSRKPIKRPSVRRESLYAESVLSDMTLDVSPIAEKSPYGYEPRTDSPQEPTGMLDPGGASTNALFSQATRSLSSLAQDFETVGVDDNNHESPPPYVNSREPSFPRDIKRRNTQGSFELNAESTNLIQVVRDNHVDLLLALLDHGINIDDVDPATKRTAIIEATNLRRTKISQILIRSGSRLHLKDIDGNTALHFAAINGDSNTCVLLLDAGAQLNEYNRDGETPLDLAARGGHTEAVVCLLNSWVSQNHHAATLLKGFLEATYSGNASTAQAFIECGVQPRKLKDSWKPVIYAAQSGSIPMMDLMLSEKCNIKAKDPEGWTALHYAAHNGHTAMVEKLLSWKVSWSTQTSKLGETALHIAILAGQISTAVALIYHKSANISMKDNDNHQALHHAVRNGDVQLTTLLLNKGAKIDAQTNYGWTPMLIAAAYGHLPLVAEFITRGVNVEDKLQDPSNKPYKKTNEAARKGYWCELRWPHPGARAIHLALEFGHDEVVRTLIASGAKVNEGDSKGWRPLHYAAWSCRPSMVELLLNRGCSPHTTTDDGNTASSLGFREHGLVASMQERQQVYEILQAAANARRKSTLTKIADFKGIGPRKTKDLGERNKAWHTAELAAALYLSGQLEEGESDTFSQLAPSTSSLNRQESKDQEDVVQHPQASSSRLTKRMTD